MANHSRECEMQITETPSIPLLLMHADHFGPIAETVEGYKHILLIVDAFTRFTWLFPTKSTGSKESIKQFLNIFNTFGNPEVLVTDRGTAFMSQEFSEFLHSRNVKHRLIAVAAPWANGLIERVNHFLKTTLRKLTDDQQTWASKISSMQYVINNTNHSSIKTTPSKLLLGYEQRNHADVRLTEALNRIAGNEFDSVLERDSSRDFTIKATNKVKEYNKVLYDKRNSKPTQYHPGE